MEVGLLLWYKFSWNNFLGNLYNIIVASLSEFGILDNGYQYMYKGFLSFNTSSKGGLLGVFSSTIVFVFPSVLSLFIKKKYFHKIVFVVFMAILFLFLALFVYFFKLIN